MALPKKRASRQPVRVPSEVHSVAAEVWKALRELVIHTVVLLSLLGLIRLTQLAYLSMAGPTGLTWFAGSPFAIPVAWAFDAADASLFAVFLICSAWKFCSAMMRRRT